MRDEWTSGIRSVSRSISLLSLTTTVVGTVFDFDILQWDDVLPSILLVFDDD